jgi:hypothetical protein
MTKAMREKKREYRVGEPIEKRGTKPRNKSVAAGSDRRRVRPKQKILGYALDLLVALTVLAVFVPFKPELPELGNDPSWRFAINQAVAQGLVFGRDVVYTYGPYASVFTKSYHPATDWLMLAGSVFLALCYSLLLTTLAAVMNRRWIPMLFVGFAASLMYSHEPIRDAPRDALLYSYPLLLALLTYRITSDAAKERRWSTRFKIVFGILFLPLGLLPLVKGSFVLICGSLAVCCVFLLLQDKQTMMAGLCAFLPLFFGVLLWRVSGQPLRGLMSFFINMRPVVSGYTEGMSLVGNVREIAIYFVASAGILYTAINDKARSILHNVVAVICYALFFFIAFKEAFVRHDAHAMVGSTAIVLAAFSGALVLRNKLAVSLIVVLFAFIACGYIDSHYVDFSAERLVTNTVDAYRDALQGLGSRVSAQSGLKAQFDEALASIKKQAPIPPLQGTADIYSFNQSALFASKQTWLPRPVFQSYQAYTAELAKLNADHLGGNKGPENVLFRVEPIDDRFPALEDGPSWPVLISNYSIAAADNFFLYLKRRPTLAAAPTSTEIYSGRHALDRDVPVPRAKDAVVAEIGVEQTFLGKLLTALYKSPELHISVSLTGGGTKTYRLIPGMARAGFVISPLINDTNDFVRLAARPQDLANNVVKSFSVSLGGKSLFWKDTYSVKLIELTRPIT